MTTLTTRKELETAIRFEAEKARDLTVTKTDDSYTLDDYNADIYIRSVLYLQRKLDRIKYEHDLENDEYLFHISYAV